MNEPPDRTPVVTVRRSPPRRTRGLGAFVGLALALQACASGGGGATDGVRRDPNLLTAADMVDVNNLSVYDAVQRLRPNWLRPRGATSVVSAGDNVPAVMVDNAFHNLDYLRNLQVNGVDLIRYIDARDATTRYGTGYVNGIVEVVMLGRGPGG